MSTSKILQSLQYNEENHGWALDVGSFLAAWSISIRSLVDSEDASTRLNLVRYARLYAFNITSRLQEHSITIDLKAFEPADLSQVDATVAEISAKVRRATSTSHRAFLLLGSATTYVELGLKPGMDDGFYGLLRECAVAAIRQLQTVPGQFPLGTEAEAVRVELLKLKGDVGSVKRVLSGRLERKAPVVLERELSASSSEGFGSA